MRILFLLTFLTSQIASGSVGIYSQPIEFIDIEQEMVDKKDIFFVTSDGLAIKEPAIGKKYLRKSRISMEINDLVSSAYYFLKLKDEKKMGYKINLRFNKFYFKYRFKHFLNYHPNSDLTLTQFAERIVIANESGKLFFESYKNSRILSYISFYKLIQDQLTNLSLSI